MAVRLQPLVPDQLPDAVIAQGLDLCQFVGGAKAVEEVQYRHP